MSALSRLSKHPAARRFPFFSGIAALALLLTVGASAAFAKSDAPGKHADRMVAKMKKELNLTADQETRIRAILAADSGFGPGAWKKGKGCKGCPKCAHGHGEGGAFGGAGFAEQMRADEVDTAALDKGFEERVDRMRDAHAHRVATFAAIHGVLTPVQRAKAADRLDAMRAKMEKRCERKCGKSCAK